MRGARPLTAGLGIPTCGGVPTPLRTRVRAGCKPNSAEPSRKAPCLHRAKSMTGRLPVTGLAASLFRSCIGIRSGESCARLPIRSGALAGQGGRGCGGSRRPRRIGHPPHQTDIIGEIAKWPILPILQTMFGGRFTAPLHPRTRATQPCRHARSRCTETAEPRAACGRARATAWRAACAPRTDDRSASSWLVVHTRRTCDFVQGISSRKPIACQPSDPRFRSRRSASQWAALSHQSCASHDKAAIGGRNAIRRIGGS